MRSHGQWERAQCWRAQRCRGPRRRRENRLACVVNRRVALRTVSQSVSNFTVLPRAHPSTGSQSGSAAPVQPQVPSTRSRGLLNCNCSIFVTYLHTTRSRTHIFAHTRNCPHLVDDHRSRGDTPWKAQASSERHTRTRTDPARPLAHLHKRPVRTRNTVLLLALR